MRMLEGVNAWNRSCDLAIHTYTTLRSCSDRVFREQTTCASLAVAASIAEGYERESSAQFCEHLRFARGSCAKLRTHLYVAGAVGIMDDRQSHVLIEESLELSRLLEGLINCFEQRTDRVR